MSIKRRRSATADLAARIDAKLDKLMPPEGRLTDREMEEYLRRNLLQASAVGADAGAENALMRVRQWRRPPKWLINALVEIQVRTRGLPKALAEWRDQIRVRAPQNGR